MRGQTWHGEIHNTARGGQAYCLDATVVPFFAPNARVAYIVVIGTDVSERVQAAESRASPYRAPRRHKRQRNDPEAPQRRLVTRLAMFMTKPRPLVANLRGVKYGVSAARETLPQTCTVSRPSAWIPALATSAGSAWNGRLP